MRTVAIGVENLCVPCGCRCRYCLLSYDGRPVGVDYERGKQFTEHFFGELERTRPELPRFYYIGYCMETPMLTDYIRFCQSIGSPSGEFLQLNGLAMREEEAADRLMERLAAVGIKTIDTTFYGQREYHDRFAGRQGDFDLLLRLLGSAGRAGIRRRVSLPIIRENMAQAQALLETLDGYSVEEYFAFLPHCKGRGWALNSQRLTRPEFDALPAPVRARFSPQVAYRSEEEWLRLGEWPRPESRTLTLSLTPENIGRLEQMPAEQIAAMLEDLDDRYSAAVPPPSELAARYEDPAGQRMYRQRDLLLEWRRRYLLDSGDDVPDLDDERGSFSVRN